MKALGCQLLREKLCQRKIITNERKREKNTEIHENCAHSALSMTNARHGAYIGIELKVSEKYS